MLNPCVTVKYDRISGWWIFMQIKQRIFKCFNMQICPLFLAAFWNFWRITGFSTTNHRWVINAQTGPVFLAHPVYCCYAFYFRPTLRVLQCAWHIDTYLEHIHQYIIWISAGLIDRLLDAVTGATGFTGQQGPDGQRGVLGEVGPTGLEGPIGVIGPLGATGPQGEQGPLGSPCGPGATGLPVSQGQRGLTGFTGQPGQLGSQGQKGQSGEIGDTGSQGSVGRPGAQGLLLVSPAHC